MKEHKEAILHIIHDPIIGPLIRKMNAKVDAKEARERKAKVYK